MAYDLNLDLVELNPNRTPPVVKLIDYGKYRYEIEKKAREARSKSKGPELKEVRLSRKIDKHDLATKAKRAKDWLEHRDKVRVYLQLMGREYMFADQAKQMLEEFREMVDGVFEQEPKLLGNRIIAIIRGKV